MSKTWVKAGREMSKKERFEKVVEWDDFVTGHDVGDGIMLFMLGLPFISTIAVLTYLIFGRKKAYWRKIK